MRSAAYCPLPVTFSKPSGRMKVLLAVIGVAPPLSIACVAVVIGHRLRSVCWSKPIAGQTVTQTRRPSNGISSMMRKRCFLTASSSAVNGGLGEPPVKPTNSKLAFMIEAPK